MKKVSYLNVNIVAIYEMNDESRFCFISWRKKPFGCELGGYSWEIMNQNFQYESVHEGKKPFNFTLCVETAITRRQNHMRDTTKIVKKYFNFDNSHFWD